MKSIYTFLLFFFVLSTSSVYSQTDTIQVIGPKQFNQILQLNENAVLIDVSCRKDFKMRHIKGAHLAQTSKDLFHLIDTHGKSKVYLLYCKEGYRSIDAGKMIYEKYKIKVCSLDGGLDAWLHSGLGLE